MTIRLLEPSSPVPDARARCARIRSWPVREFRHLERLMADHEHIGRKHGRFLPGAHVPIDSVAAIDDRPPDDLPIQPWGREDEITRQMLHVGARGSRFRARVPDSTITDPKEPSS